MWTGGVRVIVLDEDNRILMVKQEHPERTVWMVPGGGIEEGENSAQAAVREVREETGLEVEILGLIWHVEEVSERGQRFVNFFFGHFADEAQIPALGKDPELTEQDQVLQEVVFMSREEMANLPIIYPEYLKDEFWELLDNGKLQYNAFRMRT